MSMTHDLDMANPDKVYGIIEECQAALSKLNQTILTMGEVAHMGLKIGPKLDATLSKIPEMETSITGVKKVFTTVDNDIHDAVKSFQSVGGDGTF